jgi:hypothetical protein
VAVIATVTPSCQTPVQPFCSGTLVAPRVLVTAAHCVAAHTARDLVVYFGARLGPAAVGVLVDAAVVHPGFDAQTLANDVAVLRLSADAPVTPPLALQRQALDATWVGTSVRLVGFGATSAGAPPAGARLAGNATIDGVAAGDVALVPGPAITCDGDSGGAVLVDSGGSSLLLGVVSSGDPNCAAATRAIRVDVEAAFIDEQIAAAAAAAPPPAARIAEADVCTQECASDDDCPEAVPECAPPDADGHRRCVRPGVLPGLVGAACQVDPECSGGACVVVASGGLRACRCITSCNAATTGKCDPKAPRPPGAPPCSTGCSLGGEASARGAFAMWWLLAASLAAACVRRKETRT